MLRERASMNRISKTNRKFAGLAPRVKTFAVCIAIVIAILMLAVPISPIDKLFARPISVELPRFSNSRLIAKHFANFPGSTCYSIDIEIDQQKRIRLNGRETHMANLHGQIVRAFEQKGKAWVTLKVDRRAPYGIVMEMARFLRDSGWDRINLVVEGLQPSVLHHCE
jgi:biopolymer transport protein ExbD